MPKTKAQHTFWLDGGYDRDQVDACPHAPRHAWRTVRVGDAVENVYDPDELLTICQGCLVPRCGSTSDVDRCRLPRHHQPEDPFHVYESGRKEKVGA